jgi:hypothetical protein
MKRIQLIKKILLNLKGKLAGKIGYQSVNFSVKDVRIQKDSNLTISPFVISWSGVRL